MTKQQFEKYPRIADKLLPVTLSGSVNLVSVKLNLFILQTIKKSKEPGLSYLYIWFLTDIF